MQNCLGAVPSTQQSQATSELHEHEQEHDIDEHEQEHEQDSDEQEHEHDGDELDDELNPSDDELDDNVDEVLSWHPPNAVTVTVGLSTSQDVRPPRVTYGTSLSIKQHSFGDASTDLK